MAEPTPVDDLYRSRLSTANAGVLTRVREAGARFLPDLADPDTVEVDLDALAAALAALGTATGTLTTAAQVAFVEETRQYLRALIAQHTGAPLGEVAEFAAPAGLVGVAANGAPVEAVARGGAVTVFRDRLGRGLSAAEATASAMAWLARIAGSEPYRAANVTTLHAAQDDDRLTGRVTRLTRGEACDFCIEIAGSGYIPATAGFDAHAHCRCTASPEISSHVLSRAGRRAALR